MCFEAHNTGELPHEMNYQGSESGWGETSGTPCSRGQPTWTTGKPQCRADAVTKALLLPGSCKPHLDVWETRDPSNQLWDLQIFLENPLSLVCTQVFQCSSGSNENSYFQSGFAQTMSSQTTRKSVITQIGTYFSQNRNII